MTMQGFITPLLFCLAVSGCAGSKAEDARAAGSGKGAAQTAPAQDADAAPGGSGVKGSTGSNAWAGAQPPQDSDGDTILDAQDGCPGEPEDADNFEDGDGCPDPDNDKDGIMDGKDECPNDAENLNAHYDTDGCPDYNLVYIETPPPPSITYVKFVGKTTKIRKSSIAILDEIVHVIASYPQIKRVEVQAYTDMKGTKKSNLKVTKKQAETVVKYLLDEGVKPGIFIPAGYGEECPLDQGQSTEALERNRRVEFKLLETDTGCLETQLVCPDAAALGLVPEEDRKYLSGCK